MNHWSTMKLFWWMRSLKKTAVNSGKPSPYDDYFHPVSFLVLSTSFEIWWQFYSVYTSIWLGYGSQTLTHVDWFMADPPWTWPQLVRSWSNLDKGHQLIFKSHQFFSSELLLNFLSRNWNRQLDLFQDTKNNLCDWKQIVCWYRFCRKIA